MDLPDKFLLMSSSSFFAALTPWPLATVNYSCISKLFQKFLLHGISGPLSWWAVLLWACFFCLLQLVNSTFSFFCVNPCTSCPLGSLPLALGPFSVGPQPPCCPLSLDLSHCNEMNLILSWHLFEADSPTHQWDQKGLEPFLLHLCSLRAQHWLDT